MYNNNINIQILISLIKSHNIKKVIVSPGTKNINLVRSLQNDPFFEMYSCIDERSAAYMACGLSTEANEPVIISCTGATACRNYMPGLTEAYYRNIPILAITSTNDQSKVGHHIAQVLDRSVIPKDISYFNTHIPSKLDFWDCEIRINSALLELKRNNCGPVIIDFETTYNNKFECKNLPHVRVIEKITPSDSFPPIPNDCKIGILIGNNTIINNDLTKAIDSFCEKYNAIVISDHTNGYYGNFKIQHCLETLQKKELKNHQLFPDLIIYIGGITESYFVQKIIKHNSDLWRVNIDGILRDPFKNLKNIFEMTELEFFKKYNNKNYVYKNESYFKKYSKNLSLLRNSIPELPFSNIWVAHKSHTLVPENSVIHFSVSANLKAWNMFDLSNTIHTECNTGGFGIDGCISSLIGASLSNKNKLYFGVIGDLAFFYDMNSLGNRHIRNNIRIMMINNGKGGEFTKKTHPAYSYKEKADLYIAGAGHFGNKSKSLVKNYSENLGFLYLTASNKHEFKKNCSQFFDPNHSEKPIIFEIFTDDKKESDALEIISSIKKEKKWMF